MLTKDDIITQDFNFSHYRLVTEERERLGLPILKDFSPNNGLIVNHKFKDKTLFDSKKNKKYTIQDVYKHWHKGWYIMILYYSTLDNGKRSHGTLFWENLSCHDEIVLESIEESQKRYKIL